MSRRSSIDPAQEESLAARRLAPLVEMPPARRLVYAELASALLELGDRRDGAPGVFDIPKSTLHNRIKRVEGLFGQDWYDRDARVEIMFALRNVLPRWRAEAEYAREHPRARSHRRSRRAKPGTSGPDSSRSSTDPS